MSTITTEFMMAELARSKLYTAVLLQAGPAYELPENRSQQIKDIVWEHGRRNFELRAAGKLALVGPGNNDGPFLGLCIFDADEAETRELMAADPAVAAGVFVLQIGPWRSFPGDALPG